MTQARKDRSRFKPADHHADRFKPVGENLKIVRTCLGSDCGKVFIAATKTTRLCETCRKFS
jgi:hypothetical protein